MTTKVLAIDDSRTMRNLLSAALAGLSLAVDPELALSEPPARFFLLPVLKSVSYQPPPLRRNAAAETFFFNEASPQAGQSSSGSSLIFCNASSSLPQAWH